jgi:6-phosphogluconolactonase
VTGQTVLFVSEDASQAIGVYALEKDGRLSPVQRLDVGGRVVPMAVSGDRRHLYAAVRGERFEIVTLSIHGSTGRLEIVGRNPALASATYLSLDRSGRHLLAAFSVVEAPRTGMVASYPIRADGVVENAPQMLRTPPKAHAILTDATNRFALAPICNGDVILRLRFDAMSGSLSGDGLAPVIIRPDSGPRHVRFHPDGRTFYLMNEYDGAVVVFRWTAETGSLQEIQTISAAPPGHSLSAGAHGGWRGADICLTPDGRWMYVSLRTTSTITGFAVSREDGTLTVIGQTATAREPRGLAMSETGAFLFASAMEENLLCSFAIDHATGGLTLIGSTATGKGPNWIEIVRLP